MQFAKFQIPDRFAIPDLVAFNHRVHRRIDPWFDAKWVRRGTWAAVGGLLFMALGIRLFRDRPAELGKAARLSAAAPDQRPGL